MEKHYKEQIAIKESDFDMLGHVNNVVYLQWVQDIAEGHWKSIASPKVLKENIWVALRHEIDYKKETKPGEPIIAETFVASMEGVKSERITKIYHAETGQIKAQARTFWCLLDANTKRPKRISAEMKSLFV